jgi:hypothetical protein
MQKYEWYIFTFIVLQIIQEFLQYSTGKKSKNAVCNRLVNYQCCGSGMIYPGSSFGSDSKILKLGKLKKETHFRCSDYGYSRDPRYALSTIIIDNDLISENY